MPPVSVWHKCRLYFHFPSTSASLCRYLEFMDEWRNKVTLFKFDSFEEFVDAIKQFRQNSLQFGQVTPEAEWVNIFMDAAGPTFENEREAIQSQCVSDVVLDDVIQIYRRVVEIRITEKESREMEAKRVRESESKRKQSEALLGTPFNILGLPTEILSLVLDKVLFVGCLIKVDLKAFGAPGEIEIGVRDKNSKEISGNAGAKALSLLLSNKRISGPAHDILYGKNTFSGGLGAMTLFLRKIGPANVAKLKKINVYMMSASLSHIAQEMYKLQVEHKLMSNLQGWKVIFAKYDAQVLQSRTVLRELRKAGFPELPDFSFGCAPTIDGDFIQIEFCILGDTLPNLKGMILEGRDRIW